jgi:hypothetical protein
LERKKQKNMPLAKWLRKSNLKEVGGGDQKKIFFSEALATSGLWTILFNKGLWGKLIRWKYLKEGTIEEWLKTR